MIPKEHADALTDEDFIILAEIRKMMLETFIIMGGEWIYEHTAGTDFHCAAEQLLAEEMGLV